MSFDFSDHLGPTALSNSITATQTTIRLDSLSADFVTDVENESDPRFPLRIGGDRKSVV